MPNMGSEDGKVAAIRISSQSTPVDNQMTTKFGQGSAGYTYEVPSSRDETFNSVTEENSSLSAFFQRPLLVHTEVWNTGTAMSFAINPWSLYFDDKRVINRVNNYARLRCDLHVKVLINGNAFHYGRALVSYTPLATIDELSDLRQDNKIDLILRSQRPHLYLDPTTNTGGDMKLPFFYPYDYVDVVSSKWDELGILSIDTINDLQHANGATDSVTVNFYVWAENVQLVGLTSIDSITLVPQATPEYEASGMISTPATTVASMAMAMGNVPVIGPYAKASAMVASAVAGLARLFGYSRPLAEVGGVSHMHPRISGSLALVNINDNSHKLALDAKQECTIDPRTVGLHNEDEMTITSVVDRESYFVTFPWQIGQATDTHLFSVRVTPNLFRTFADPDNNVEWHITPSKFVSNMFRYWHGAMKFRIQVVASNFHKGRLRVIYEPNNVTPVAESYNVTKSYIIDLAQTKEITLEVGWHQKKYWMPCFHADTLYSTTGLAAPLFDAFNGIISVYVLNELTTPNSAVVSDVEVNVYTSMCCDADFSDPTDQEIKFLTFGASPGSTPLQGMVNQAEPEMVDSAPAPVAQQSEVIAECKEVQFDQVVPGESVRSLRALLKRFCYYRNWFANQNLDAGYIFYYNVSSQYPLMRGPWSDGIDVTADGTWNYVNNSFVSYITPAYAAFRGGIRWKYFPLYSQMCGARFARRLPNYRLDFTQGLKASADSFHTTSRKAAYNYNAMLNHVDTGSSTLAGMAYAGHAPNEALEVEYPYYADRRFNPARIVGYATQTTFNDQWVGYYSTINVTDDTYASTTTYVAAADDYACFFFLGLPKYYRINDPAPTG